MWFKSIKRLVFISAGIIPLTFVTAASINSCAPTPASVKIAKATIQSFNLDEVGFKDYYVPNEWYPPSVADMKRDVRHYIKTRIQQKNESLNGSRVKLAENVDYKLDQFDQLDWENFIKLPSLRGVTKKTLNITITAMNDDQYCKGTTTFLIINSSDVQSKKNLEKLNLENLIYDCSDSTVLSENIKEDLNATLNLPFPNNANSSTPLITETDYEILCNGQELPLTTVAQTLVNNYESGIPLYLTIQAKSTSQNLINSTNVFISSAKPKIVNELKDNYTVADYAGAIDCFTTATRKMTNEQILENVNKLTAKLTSVNQSTIQLYQRLLNWIQKFDISENWSKFGKPEFEKCYKTFAPEINSNFYWDEDLFIKMGKLLLKNYTFAPKTNEYWAAQRAIIGSVPAIKSEFLVHELLVLCLQFAKHNLPSEYMPLDPSSWTDNEKQTICNLALELNFWIATNSFSGNIKTGEKFWPYYDESEQADWSLVNSNYLTSDLHAFSVYFHAIASGPDHLPQTGNWQLSVGQYVISNQTLNPDQSWYRNTYRLPFMTITGKPEIKPISPQLKA